MGALEKYVTYSYFNATEDFLFRVVEDLQVKWNSMFYRVHAQVNHSRFAAFLGQESFCISRVFFEDTWKFNLSVHIFMTVCKLVWPTFSSP
jgi:hypothetical protein